MMRKKSGVDKKLKEQEDLLMKSGMNFYKRKERKKRKDLNRKKKSLGNKKKSLERKMSS